eukprot:CAMPEP_0119056962 /NCGR_PEP_ID=MMETSP1178-20130426/1512_1 /TAXON_ID=33656 /ORGANISM="unid sp, Strain CCMP2000" /LENGTH=161 /DNA_ID=CAMNT_0007037747 /DNA_START=13 /DNA_END=498 /DNA_ORIENTATION=+
MKTIFQFTLFVSLAVLVACSSEDDSMDEPGGGTPASGVIAGEAWEFDVGTAFLEEIDNQYTINLLGVVEGATDDGCSILFPGEEYVRFTVSAEVGRTDIPFTFANQGVKFYPDRSVGGFELATTGYVEITEITNTQVRGELNASFDALNEVSGSFTVTICQ